MFRYPGGKTKLKKQIRDSIKGYYDKYDCWVDCRYVEPFFGGGAIGRELFPHIKKIAINDYDIGVAMFWHSVINNHEELCDLVKEFIPTIDKFYEFKKFFLDKELRNEVLKNEKCSFVETGFMKMALHQISFSGLGVMSGGPLGGNKQQSKYKIDCRWNPSYIVKKVIKYHNVLCRNDIFRNTCCYDDFYVFLKKVIDKGDSFIYLDPPYYDKGPELYQFHFEEKKHKKLANFLEEIDVPWLLSYDCVEEIRELYSWAEMK